MLGTRVASALDDVEKQLHVELTQLDRFSSTQNTGAAYRRLMREQHHWDAAASGGTGSGKSGEAAVLAAGVQVLWDVLQLLPDFKRKTLQAQHVLLFTELMAAEAEKRRLEAASKKKDQAAATAGAVAHGAPGDDAAEVEMLQADGQQGPSSAGPASQQQQQQQQAQQPVDGSRQPDTQPPPAEAQDSGALAAILAAAEAGQAFAASSCWRGRVAGYCFKAGDSGVGYYRDAPPTVEAFLTFARVGTDCQ